MPFKTIFNRSKTVRIANGFQNKILVSHSAVQCNDKRNCWVSIFVKDLATKFFLKCAKF